MKLKILGPVLAALAVGACTLIRPAPAPHPAPAPAPAPSPAPSAPAPVPAPAPAPEAAAPPVAPAPPPPRQFHLGTAATALVSQAHRQAASGDYGQAAATIERALRIEPDNPLLWVELGRVQLGQNNPGQAEQLGHKALSLATGDPVAQASAWRLIADALRARGRNAEAADADRRAAGLTPH